MPDIRLAAARRELPPGYFYDTPAPADEPFVSYHLEARWLSVIASIRRENAAMGFPLEGGFVTAADGSPVRAIGRL